jgi:hypothetical protein
MDSPKETPIDEFGQLDVILLYKLPDDLRNIITQYVNVHTTKSILAIFRQWYDDMPYKIIIPSHSLDGDDSEELLFNFAKYYIECAYLFLVDPWLEQLPNDRTNWDVWDEYTDNLEDQHDVIIIQFGHFRGHYCYARFKYQECDENKGNCAECDCTTDTIYLSLFSKLESSLGKLTIENVFNFFKSENWALVNCSNFTNGRAITDSGYYTTEDGEYGEDGEDGKYVKLTIDVPYTSLIQDVEEHQTSHDHQNNPRSPHCTHFEFDDDRDMVIYECNCSLCNDRYSDY